MQQLSQNTTRHTTASTCLIIEDSAFDREKLSRIMRSYRNKIHIKTATTLKSARAALNDLRADLILLDNNLPDGLGANFALELANDARLADIPVIMVSDWPSLFMWEKAARAGVHYVLSKAEFDARYVYAALRGDRELRAS